MALQVIKLNLMAVKQSLGISINKFNTGFPYVVELEFQQKTKELIDSLKGICANYGLGNDGNEFKIITQVFFGSFPSSASLPLS